MPVRLLRDELDEESKRINKLVNLICFLSGKTLTQLTPDKIHADANMYVCGRYSMKGVITISLLHKKRNYLEQLKNRYKK